METIKRLLLGKEGLLLLFSLVFCLQAFGSISQKSWAFDEPKHLASGYSWLYGEQPVAKDTTLFSAFYALPLIFLDLNPVRSGVKNHLEAKFPEHYYPWNYGLELLQRNFSKREAILTSMKAMQVLLGLLLGILLYFWAAEWFGSRVGLFCLTLYSFSPSILTYTRIIGSDFTLTLALPAFILALYLDIENKRKRSAALLVVAALFTFVAKLNGIVYVFACLVCLCLFNAFYRKTSLKALARYAFLFLLAVFLLNLLHGFNGTLTPLSGHQLQSETMQWLQSIPLLRDIPLLLPTVYIEGFDYTLAQKPENQAYKFLFGMFSQQGWWYYFLAAFSFKVTAPLLLLLSISFFLRPIKSVYRMVFLIVPVLVVFTFPSFVYKLNIGFRYVLPALPFLLLLAAATLGHLAQKVKFTPRLLAYGLVAYQVAAGLFIYPSYSSFFNLLAGGPANGYKLLDDSNLGWSENKKAAAKYAQDHKPQRGLPDPYKYTRAHFMIHSCEINRSPEFPYGPDHGRYGWVKDLQPVKHFGYEIFVFDTR